MVGFSVSPLRVAPMTFGFVHENFPFLSAKSALTVTADNLDEQGSSLLWQIAILITRGLCLRRWCY